MMLNARQKRRIRQALLETIDSREEAIDALTFKMVGRQLPDGRFRRVVPREWRDVVRKLKRDLRAFSRVLSELRHG